ncbi:ABC transporter ATP-binding protein [Patescibacteria group bacterium]|nr:ABC transporter ATP-binding protein [Patescibacteria group bacterium]
MTELLLDVRQLTKRFGSPAAGFLAVDNISFGVREGEIVGLLGPNGAGKSTTIFMLLDLISPTSGEIRIFGGDYRHNRDAILQKLNYSSTYVEMAPRLSVYENLLVMARLYQVPDEKKEISTYVDKFGVREFLGAQFHTLSAGQKTRVVLCKAFLNHPALLLLDEPTASLDPDVALLVRQEILESRTRGMTVLITSHNMAEVEEVCDRVLFINHGKIVSEDTPVELARKVRHIRVQLMMKDGQKRTVAFAKKAGFPVEEKDRFVTIEVDEGDIAYLLASLADQGVEYRQISIDKPTLEDYFIKMLGGGV